MLLRKLIEITFQVSRGIFFPKKKKKKKKNLTGTFSGEEIF